MSLQEDLAKATDELNDELDTCERYLESLNYAERTSVPFEDGSLLVWGKHAGNWRLSCGDGSPLLSASKQRRIEAALLLPKLIEALKEASASRLAEIKYAIEVCRQVRKA